MARHSDPATRRCQRVLAMVHELHKLGHQRLRIMPGMSPSGMHWRCNITPVTNILRAHGAMARDFFDQSANYSSSDGADYFGWEDARKATARDLATMFGERFPDLLGAGHGRDWTYAGWYVEMLGHAERGDLPVAYADWVREARPTVAPHHTGNRFRTSDATSGRGGASNGVTPTVSPPELAVSATAAPRRSLPGEG